MTQPQASIRKYGRVIVVAGLTIAAMVVAMFLGQLAISDQTVAQPTPYPTAAPSERLVEAVEINSDNDLPARVVLFALGGARADFVEPYIVDGTMRNLAMLASNGLVTEYALGVDPSSPAVSHTSLACGSYPRTTGVVGERFRRLGQPIDRVTDSIEGVSPDVPPLWAWDDSKNGPADAILFWPGADRGTIQEGDIFLSLDNSLARPQLHRVELSAPTSSIDGVPMSFSPYLLGNAAIEGPNGEVLVTFSLVALDSQDDAVAEYDAIAIAFAEGDGVEPGPFTVLISDSWAVLQIPGRPTAGVALKLKVVEMPGETETDSVVVTLYQSGVVELLSRPTTLARELVAEVGAPLPPPDKESLDSGLIAPAGYLALAERRLRWQTDAAAYIQERLAPHMMLASFDIVGQISAIRLAESDDGVYDPMLRGAYRAADQAIGRLLAGLDLGQTTVLIGSPHGYASAGVALNMHALLREVYQAGGERALASYSSGGSAHIVVNQAGREPGGRVSGAMHDQVVQTVAEAFAEFALEGEPAFARVLTGPSLREIGLDSPHSGDIFVQAAPGMVLYENDPTGESRLWWPTNVAAAGYDASRPEMRGIFVMAGRRISDLGMVATIHLVDIAPTMAELLNIGRPDSIEGRVLHELLR